MDLPLILNQEQLNLLEDIQRSLAINPRIARQYSDQKVLTEVKKEIPSGLVNDDKLETIKHVARWFKEDYMTWVGEPVPCSDCGKNMKVQIEYFDDWRLRKLEHNTCDCGNILEFPRYGDALELIKTIRGLCGEYSFLLAGILESLGIETTFTHDLTDHAWNEANINGKWIHVDSTLEPGKQIDNPLLYEREWGKKLHYIFAFHPDGHVEDVTHRYTNRPPEVQARRIVDPIPQHLIALTNLKSKIDS